MTERKLTCIGCPMGCAITVAMQGNQIEKVVGNTCKRGEVYARAEVTAPVRRVTSTVKVTGGSMPVVSVKTAADVPKEKVEACMQELRRLVVTAPIEMGAHLMEDIAGTGVAVVATRRVDAKGTTCK